MTSPLRIPSRERDAVSRKPEIRISKFKTNPKLQSPILQTAGFFFNSELCFFRISHFELRISASGSVWESNPLRALFKPATGFEDQGPHQRCKHSRSLEFWRKPAHLQDFVIVPHPFPPVYPRLSGAYAPALKRQAERRVFFPQVARHRSPWPARPQLRAWRGPAA